MQLVFGEKREPVDAFLLVMPKLGLDWDGNCVRLDLATVEQLVKKLALAGPLGEELVWEARRIGDAGLWMANVTASQVSPTSQRTSHIEATRRTSSGTILTRAAKVLVAESRTSSSGSLMRPSIGTTMKRT